MSKLKQLATAAVQAVERGELDAFKLDPDDFLSVREGQRSTATELSQEVASLNVASEILNRSSTMPDVSGGSTSVISPVVIPKDSRSLLWVVVVVVLAVAGLVGGQVFGAFFGWPYWVILAGFVAFKAWQNSYVMIPDGCQALITKFGKLETTVGPGRTWLFDPRKKIGYIVNTAKEFPYNAPIREAPTAGRVTASVGQGSRAPGSGLHRQSGGAPLRARSAPVGGRRGTGARRAAAVVGLRGRGGEVGALDSAAGAALAGDDSASGQRKRRGGLSANAQSATPGERPGGQRAVVTVEFRAVRALLPG